MSKYRSPAIRRYVRRLAFLMAAYFITLFAAVRLLRSHTVEGPAAYALAILPALPVIGVFWAVMRYEPPSRLALVGSAELSCRCSLPAAANLLHAARRASTLLAGRLGFEPRQSAPKALDLPLVDRPKIIPGRSPGRALPQPVY